MAAPSFEEFLSARGFDSRRPAPFLYRMFVTPFGEAGFHRFWQLWNPVYGYVLLRLYVSLGGRRRPLPASFAVFICCGFCLHDCLLIIATRRLSLTCTIMFAVFWLLTVLSRSFEPRLRQQQWPRWANAILNVMCLVAGGVAGAVVGPRLSS